MLSVIAVLTNELNGTMVNDIPWLNCRGRRIQDINIIQCSQYSGICCFFVVFLKETKASLSVNKFNLNFKALSKMFSVSICGTSCYLTQFL